jgi:hypothetical protein
MRSSNLRNESRSDGYRASRRTLNRVGGSFGTAEIFAPPAWVYSRSSSSCGLLV